VSGRSPRSPSGAPSGAVRVVPPEASPEKRKAAVVETVRRVGLSPRSAALSVGVAASTFYDWMDLDESFREQIAVAERQFERAMLLVIVSSAVKTRSWRAAMAVLERRFPDLWTPRLNVSVEPQSLEDELDANLSDEQLEGRLRELAAAVEQRLSKEEA
jgi:hypothetical protein